MPTLIRIAIVGDRNDAFDAHRAIPLALAHAASARGVDVVADWLPTERVAAHDLAAFDGFWCAPGSPYRDMDGALAAITHARASRLPFLGTCGGFQHAVIEFARHVLRWDDAMHAESHPGLGRAVIAPLECALVEAHGTVSLAPDSRLARAYGGLVAPTTYRCRYGLNPEFGAALTAGALRATAHDEHGDLRGVELDGHPFFVATLWQPERAALEGRRVPLAEAFVDAVRAGVVGHPAPPGRLTTGSEAPMSAHHTATILWQRGDADFIDRRYSRAHTWAFDGGAIVAASSSPHVVPVPMSDASAVDPEEAYVAALSSCHMLWFLDIACRAGYRVDRYEDAADGRMGRDDKGRLVVDLVTLRPHTRFSSDRVPDAATLEQLHHDAHAECFLANSVRTEIRCEPALA